MGSENSAVTEDDFCREAEFKWFEMEKRIKELVKGVNISNVTFTADEIAKLENLLEGRGVFCREVMESQKRFPDSSNVYAALVAVINPRFPDVGYLLVKRVVLEFKKACESGNKNRLQSTTKFLAHLVNQMVVTEVLALQSVLFMLGEGDPSSDNVDVAVNFCIECGSSLMDYHGGISLDEVLDEFWRLLRSRAVEERAKVMIRRLFVARKSKFRMNPGIIDELDLVEVEDQVTHDLSLLLHEFDPEYTLDNFRRNVEVDDDEDDEINSLGRF